MALEYFSAFQQLEEDMHSHNFIEILFVLRGSFKHTIGGESYKESTGGLTILNYDQYHSLVTQDGPVELMNIYLDPERYPFPELPAPLNTRLYKLIPLHPELGNRLNRIQHIQVADAGHMSRLVKMLYQEQFSEHPGREAAVAALMTLVLIELCRAVPVSFDIPQQVHQKSMEKAIAYLEEHAADPIRLEELVAHTGLQKTNLCRRFKTYTGMSIGNYLTQRRLAIALQRLRTTDDKIITICQDSGFSDVSRFNKLFRMAFGSSPSAYRNHLILESNREA